MRILIAAMLLLPGFASAEEFRVELKADFTGDGTPDRAELTGDQDNDSASLSIYVGQPDGSETLRERAPALVWMGSGMMGQQPEMRITERGSLQVIAMNESIGRNRWHEVLTIAYRDDIFKVAGYTYYWADTLDMNAQGVCDINLLTGKGELVLGEDEVKTPFRTDLRAMPVPDWIREIPKECRAGWQ